jgi:hypothetical protein
LVSDFRAARPAGPRGNMSRQWRMRAPWKLAVGAADCRLVNPPGVEERCEHAKTDLPPWQAR